MGVSITMLKDEFRKHIQPFQDDISRYSMHNMKSSAASNPTCKHIVSNLLDMHTGGDAPPNIGSTLSSLLTKECLATSKSLSL